MFPFHVCIILDLVFARARAKINSKENRFLKFVVVGGADKDPQINIYLDLNNIYNPQLVKAKHFIIVLCSVVIFSRTHTNPNNPTIQ